MDEREREREREKERKRENKRESARERERERERGERTLTVADPSPYISRALHLFSASFCPVFGASSVRVWMPSTPTENDQII